MNICVLCLKEKPESEFSKKKSKPISSCKECRAAYAARYYMENKAKLLAYADAYQSSCHEKIAAYKAKYGGRSFLKTAAKRAEIKSAVAGYQAAFCMANRSAVEVHRNARKKLNDDFLPLHLR